MSGRLSGIKLNASRNTLSTSSSAPTLLKIAASLTDLALSSVMLPKMLCTRLVLASSTPRMPASGMHESHTRPTHSARLVASLTGVMPSWVLSVTFGTAA